MEKTESILAVSVFLLLLLTSCHTGEKNFTLKTNQLEFDTLIVNQKQYLQNDTTNSFCELNVQFVYPVTISGSNLKKIQQLYVRNTFGQVYSDLSPKDAMDQYKKDFFENYETDAQIFQKELQQLESHPAIISQNFDSQHENEFKQNEFYSYHETLSSKTHFNKNDLLSFQLFRANSKSGSATYSTYNNYVIDLQTSSLITENDLFIGGYDVALQQLFAAKLLQQNNVKTIYDLEDLGYFGIEEIMPNRNFLIDDKGITYIFNKGEYSAYLLDAPEIFIPFEDLKMLLRENTLVSKLAEQ